MKIVGLITEYNPFHNGHLYHIQQAKRITGADSVIVVMSGDYVQRGVPAVMPKRLRVESALECGASAVFELPVCYATGSAELFAQSASLLIKPTPNRRFSLFRKRMRRFGRFIRNCGSVLL